MSGGSHRRRLVLRSIEDPSGDRCVDIFRRPDGSFGYEEYRRDAEDPRGWQPVGGYDRRRFTEEVSALADAEATIGWLSASMK